MNQKNESKEKKVAAEKKIKLSVTGFSTNQEILKKHWIRPEEAETL